MALALDRAALLIAAHRSAHSLFDGVGGHAADGVTSAAATLQSADVLDAFAVLIGFFLVAVDQAVSRDGLAARLAGLAASVLDARLACNFAALLKGATADGAHARLHFRIQRLGRRPV